MGLNGGVNGNLEAEPTPGVPVLPYENDQKSVGITHFLQNIIFFRGK